MREGKGENNDNHKGGKGVRGLTDSRIVHSQWGGIEGQKIARRFTTVTRVVSEGQGGHLKHLKLMLIRLFPYFKRRQTSVTI
ncbi:hypothetical protein CEXT_416111 [Caerostris extrusa]|uniref:Uncharacterized protein n=1 Tax=Caerostris extrusa TaxID=172846 RepID=A0AAV4N2F2_CAEEX|nr:hypothetical protein CEXT_416111 [Caerostris extrusa]